MQGTFQSTLRNINSLNAYEKPSKMENINLAILQMRKLKHKRV